jgi:hypothetical protein
MSESRLNIELFKKIRDRIATIPESYDQDTWVKSSLSSPCGTVACLAGETIICAAPSVEQGIRELQRLDRQGEYLVPKVAAELLGLEGDYDGDDEVDNETMIFVADAAYWPWPYRDQFREAETGARRAEIAVAYLDHIISSGKVLE